MLGRALARLAFLGFVAATNAFAETPTAVPTPARVVFPGGLDRSFGSAGNATPQVERLVWDTVILQRDGKIVALGRAAGSVIARYDANGKLDETFGDGGIVVPSLPALGFLSALALTPAGDIVVVGSSGGDVLVMRFDTDGQLDAHFAGGVVTTSIGPHP